MKKHISLFCLFLISSVSIYASVISEKKDKNTLWSKQSYSISGYTEDEARRLHDSRKTDPIEGIWQNYEGSRWSIERFTDKDIPESFKYRIVRLRGMYSKPGAVEGFFELTADKNTFNLSVYRRLGRITYISHVASLLYRNRLNIEGTFWNSRLMKIYPTSESAPAPAPGSASSSGSGFALSSDGYIATCNHVTSGAKYIQVTGINGDFLHSYSAKVVLTDPMTDLAVIKIDDPDFDTLGTIYYDLRNSTPVEGEPCFAVGYPAADYLGENVKITNGIVSAVNAGKAGPVYCQISVPVTHGNSGCPLFDNDGNVLGIVKGGYRSIAEFANVAVKSTYLKLLLDSDPVLRNLTFKPVLEKRSLPEIISQVKNNVYFIKIYDSEPPKVSSEFNKPKKAERSVPRPKLSEIALQTPVEQAKEKQRSGDYNGAIVILNQELQSNPIQVIAYYLRALCWSALGQQKSAVADYDMALKYHKEANAGCSLFEIYQNKALCQASINEYTSALSTINLAMREEPNDPKNYEIRGCIYYYLKNYQLCITDLSSTLNLGNKSATVYYFRALANLAINNKSAARLDMEQASSMGDPDAIEWLKTQK